MNTQKDRQTVRKIHRQSQTLCLLWLTDIMGSILDRQWKDRQTVDRQIDKYRKIDRQIERKIDKHIQKDRQIDSWKDTYICRVKLFAYVGSQI